MTIKGARDDKKIMETREKARFLSKEKYSRTIQTPIDAITINYRYYWDGIKEGVFGVG